MLSDITPVLLTFNEAPNIGRTLACLTWAKDIIVVDSGSTDDTASIVAAFPQVRVFHRSFDTHGNQWRYATQETGINTNWILRLDADYEVTERSRTNFRAWMPMRTSTRIVFHLIMPSLDEN